jgi:hypothetical protein
VKHYTTRLAKKSDLVGWLDYKGKCGKGDQSIFLFIDALQHPSGITIVLETDKVEAFFEISRHAFIKDCWYIYELAVSPRNLCRDVKGWGKQAMYEACKYVLSQSGTALHLAPTYNSDEFYKNIGMTLHPNNIRSFEKADMEKFVNAFS